MAEIDLTALAGRVEDAPEPIKRTNTRDGAPNPFEPMVAASWDARTKRGHKGTEVGSTKQVRAYTNDQATAIVRALRRASDSLNLGVKIDAPTEDYTEQVPVTDGDGNAVTDGDGNAVTETKTKTRFVKGTIRFESVKRQERKRKTNGEQASTDAPETPEGGNGDDGNGEPGEQSDVPESDRQPEPAWQ
jgi:hypothetical protein